MKNIKPIYRSVALLLALLMFTTSVGFAVDLHYCGGQLKSFGILTKAKNCHEMAAKMASCPHHQKQAASAAECAEQEQKDCCKNELEYVQSDQDLQTQTGELTLHPPLQQFLTAYIFTVLNLSLAVNERPAFSDYRPPSVLKDRPVLHQSFLL